MENEMTVFVSIHFTELPWNKKWNLVPIIDEGIPKKKPNYLELQGGPEKGDTKHL